MSLTLYFAGGGGKEVSDYLDSMNCDRLFSQLNDRKAIEQQIEAIKEGRTKGKLFIDSGAYSAHTKGAKLDVDEYINFLNQIEPYCDIYAQVDYIAGVFGQPKPKEEVLKAPQLSWENYEYMRPKLTNHDKLIPVFHQGEDFKWLKNMLEATFNGEHVPYIGVSCSKDRDHREWPIWFTEVFDIIKKSSNPNVKTHAFGMTSLKYLKMFPFTSADSTSWIKFAAYGIVLTDKFGGIRLSDRQEHDPQHICNLRPEEQEYVKSYFEKQGFKYEDLNASSNYRTMLNAKFYKDFADSYRYEPPMKMMSFC